MAEGEEREAMTAFEWIVMAGLCIVIGYLHRITQQLATLEVLAKK